MTEKDVQKFKETDKTLQQNKAQRDKRCSTVRTQMMQSNFVDIPKSRVGQSCLWGRRLPQHVGPNFIPPTDARVGNARKVESGRESIGYCLQAQPGPVSPLDVNPLTRTREMLLAPNREQDSMFNRWPKFAEPFGTHYRYFRGRDLIWSRNIWPGCVQVVM